jgi:hypothetical protein
MTYQQITETLPANAEWSCSFGNPGEGGYTEYHRTPDGTRYVISNGSWDSGGREWTMEVK